MIDENDNPVKGQFLEHEVKTFDERSFKEAFDYIDLKRRAVQAEVDEEHDQELERQKEAERLAARTIPERIIAFLLGT
ncbi:hypothetical protein [Gimesia fumaroli]|uniref:hypothetical protein n=1 Tax=Gimesia fumaroli TaxID=2527976 RepID=UPI0011A41184|nr:hypothetical protein [Gimesia fumaroli]